MVEEEIGERWENATESSVCFIRKAITTPCELKYGGMGWDGMGWVDSRMKLLWGVLGRRGEGEGWRIK